MPERLPEGSRFAVLASGSGTNLQALLDAYPKELVVAAGDKKGAFAFERARRARSNAKAPFLSPAATANSLG